MLKCVASSARYRSAVESLESRTFLCGTVPAVGSSALVSASERTAATVATKHAATKTTLTATAGTIGQPITFSATVRAAGAAGSPTGTVNILDHRNMLGTITLSPATSTDPRYAISTGTFTFTQPPGGSTYFSGKHPISAAFAPTGVFTKSNGNATFVVSTPIYSALPDGVQVDTIIPGQGTSSVETGQTVNVLYTGFFAKNGKIFDDSSKDGGTPFNLTLGSGGAIVGFDEGIDGMQLGESRLILIPPAEGYGSKANGPIPGNSTLLFEVTLESVS